MLETIEEEGLLVNVAEMGDRMRSELESIEGVVSTRGMGLLVAAELAIEAGPVAVKCLEKGLLVNAVRPTSIRFAPPLNVKSSEVDRALGIFSRVVSRSTT